MPTRRTRTTGSRHPNATTSNTPTLLQILSLTSTLITSTQATTNTEYLTVSNPRFGGCSTDSTNITHPPTYCALKPSDCTRIPYFPKPLYTYVPPHKIRTTNICHNPHEVTIGRCTSSIDGDICSASSESCEISSEFTQEEDEICTIVQTSDTGVMTRYPQCKVIRENSDTPPGSRCVLSKEDCIPVVEEFENMVHLPWDTPCHCYDVPTGLCHLDGVSPLTADASFCAVGAYDCPGNYTFLSSVMLLNMNDPPRQCFLCENDELEEVLLHDSVVESGGCYSDGGFVDTHFARCALESTECFDEEVFMSSQQMYELGQIPCRADEFVGGDCTSGLDSVGCTNRAESCKVPSKFVARDTCRMHKDELNTGEHTYFGRCQSRDESDRWCVWGYKECNAALGEKWYPAEVDSNWLSACNCEHVKTGACRHDGGGAGGEGYYCAVSAMGCADPRTYVPSGLLEKQLGLDCRLCQPRKQVFLPTISPTVVLTEVAAPLGEEEEGLDSSTIAAIVGACLWVTVGLSCFTFHTYRQGWNRSTFEEKERLDAGADIDLDIDLGETEML